MFVRQTLDGAAFHNLLVRSRVIQHCINNNCVFMQDNAKVHTCKDVKAYLNNKGVEQLPKQWPAASPDLNPIEMLWSHVHTLLAAKAPAETTEELMKQVQEVWDAIPMNVVNNFVLKFTDLVVACDKQNGGAFQHL